MFVNTEISGNVSPTIMGVKLYNLIINLKKKGQKMQFL